MYPAPTTPGSKPGPGRPGRHPTGILLGGGIGGCLSGGPCAFSLPGCLDGCLPDCLLGAGIGGLATPTILGPSSWEDISGSRKASHRVGCPTPLVSTRPDPVGEEREVRPGILCQSFPKGWGDGRCWYLLFLGFLLLLFGIRPGDCCGVSCPLVPKLLLGPVSGSRRPTAPDPGRFPGPVSFFY